MVKQEKVSFKSCLNIQKIIDRLSNDGIVVFEDMYEKEQFIDLTNRLGDIYNHRDSDASGITRLEVREKIEHNVGFQGLNSRHLPIHTDCSGGASPPNLLLTQCEETASQGGGAATLLDGKLFFSILKTYHPDILDIAMRGNSIIYEDANGNTYNGSMFFKNEKNNRIILRFRIDEKGFYSFPLSQKMPILLGIIELNKIKISLDPGCGYIIQNGRWLHGRDSFQGNRVVNRSLVKTDNMPFHHEIGYGFYE